ncbi:uroporphyrinogen-III synthase [Candidatus Binatia bacterium]|nr:uroporphyrinogen-III synthase [Candidatus Binatia bacterium]
MAELIRRFVDGTVDVALFTSATQVYHVLQVAQEIDLARDLVEAGARVVVGSIGPICSDALRGHGLAVDLEPEHPRMGQLVAAVAARGPGLLTAKRAAPLGGFETRHQCARKRAWSAR